MGRRTILLIAALVVAAVGTTLVFLYVHGLQDANADTRKPVEVLVAKGDIPAGTTGANAQQSGLFEKKTVEKGAVADGTISDPTPIGSLVALAPIFAGQQIQTAMFGQPGSGAATGLPLDPGQFAMSITMGDPNRVAGFLQPGADVAIFITYTPKNSPSGVTTRVLLPKVKVIATGNTTVTTTTKTQGANGAEQTTQLPLALLTLAVNQVEFQKIVAAQTISGSGLYFGLLNKDSVVNPNAAGTNLDNLFK